VIIEGLLNQTISYIYSVAIDRYGDITKTLVYSDVACRFQRKKGIIYDDKGEERQYSAEIWMSSDYTSVVENYRITKDSIEYKVIHFEHLYDLTGEVDHVKLYLK